MTIARALHVLGVILWIGGIPARQVPAAPESG